MFLNTKVRNQIVSATDNYSRKRCELIFGDVRKKVWDPICKILNFPCQRWPHQCHLPYNLGKRGTKLMWTAFIKLWSWICLFHLEAITILNSICKTYQNLTFFFRFCLAHISTINFKKTKKPHNNSTTFSIHTRKTIPILQGLNSSSLQLLTS